MKNKKLPKEKKIWFVSSVSLKLLNGSRTWSFWSSKKKAIEEGIFGWSGAEFFYESGYYDFVVVEANSLNHPLPIRISKDQIWFKIVPEKMGTKKKKENIRESIVKTECPEEFKNISGYF